MNLKYKFSNFFKTKKKIKNISDILIIPEFLEINYKKLQNKPKFNKFWFKKIISYIKNGNIIFSKINNEKHIKIISIFSFKFLIIEKAIKYLLEIIFEKWFKINLINFKIEKNYYGALKQISQILKKNYWFIEGKIYNDIINYNYLLININNIVKDQPFVDLIYKIIKIQKNRKNILFLLSNIYLYNFDFNILKLLKKNKNIANFNYIRFNNNFIIGINADKNICIYLKNKINILINNKFNLQLNINKKKINFLGYTIYLKKKPINLLINDFKLKFKVPIDKILIKLFLNGYCKKKGTPTSCGKLIYKSLYEIIINYLILQQKLCNYYFITINYYQFINRIHYILKYSCALTFASKLKLNTLKKVFKKFGKNLTIYLIKKKIIKIFFIRPNKKN